MNPEYCERCELDFSATVVAADPKSFNVEVAGLCHACAVARDNAAEEAFVAHETDRFFGGGR